MTNLTDILSGSLPPGPQGIQGITGAGTQGAQGLTGTGTQGPQGTAGPSTTINATTNTTTARYLVGVAAVGSAATAYACTAISMASSIVSATDFTATSDAKFKNILSKIDNAVEKVGRLVGVEFQWNQLARDNNISDDERVQIGLIAQDVEKIYPSLVAETDGNKSLTYSKIVALLVEAIKEMSGEINTLRHDVDELKAR